MSLRKCKLHAKHDTVWSNTMDLNVLRVPTPTPTHPASVSAEQWLRVALHFVTTIDFPALSFISVLHDKLLHRLLLANGNLIAASLLDHVKPVFDYIKSTSEICQCTFSSRYSLNVQIRTSMFDHVWQLH